MSVEGVVDGILDLTDPMILAALGTNGQEISGSWLTVVTPPTQTLAQAAFDSGKIKGIKYPSAKNMGGGLNLVIFPERLRARDHLEVYDPAGNLAQRIGS